MSYEGYVQELCANGHLRQRDAYQATPPQCSCGAAFVYTHNVDETNGYDPADPGTYPKPFEVEKEADYVICNLGHKHYTSERTYKIPV